MAEQNAWQECGAGTAAGSTESQFKISHFPPYGQHIPPSALQRNSNHKSSNLTPLRDCLQSELAMMRCASGGQNLMCPLKLTPIVILLMRLLAAQTHFTDFWLAAMKCMYSEKEIFNVFISGRSKRPYQIQTNAHIDITFAKL